MIVDPFGGYNKAIDQLNNTFTRVRQEDRQSSRDELNAQSARQQLAMGNIQLQGAERAESNRQEAIAAGAAVQPGIRTSLYDQHGPPQPIDNTAGLSQRDALQQKIDALRGKAPSVIPGEAGRPSVRAQLAGYRQQTGDLQAQMDAIPATAQAAGEPLAPIAMQEQVPVTDQDRMAAMARSYMKNGAMKEATEILQQGGAMQDMLTKMKARAIEYGDPQAAANFDARIEHLGKTEDLMAKLKKADPTGGILKQVMTAHPDMFPGMDPAKIGVSDGMVTWPVNQNGVQGIGYMDTDGKIKFQPANEKKGFDSIDMGDKVKIIPRDGSPAYFEKKGITPGAAANITINQGKVANVAKGKPPAGYRFMESGDLEPIPGGPADQKVTQALKSQEGAVQSIDTAINSINELLSHPGRASATGKSSMSNMIAIPGGDAKTFLHKLETFKSQMFVPMVQQMKGMGQLSDAEGRKLTAAVGALEPSMSEAEFVGSLKTILGELRQTRQRTAQPIAANQPTVTKGGFKITVVP